MSNASFAELRLYRVEAGRMGDMRARYHGPLQQLFSRHGIQVDGAWHSSNELHAPLFIYLMHWDSLEQRQHAWGGFYGDPQWQQVRDETNCGSELVERFDLHFMRPLKALANAAGEGFAQIEMLVPRVRIGAGGPARQWLSQQAPSVLAQHGAAMLGAYEHLTGNDLPRVCLFLGWSNAAARQGSLRALEVDPLGQADRYVLLPA